MSDERRHQEMLRELSWLRGRVADLEARLGGGMPLDGATGLPGPEAFRRRVTEEVDRARRYRRALSLVVVAVDQLSGLELHEQLVAKEDVMVSLSRRLKAGTRSHDLLGRIGRAEFGLLLTETDAESALQPLDRMLIELEMAAGGAVGAAGVSIGVAALEPGISGEGLLANARMACKRAQDRGGGCVVLAAGPSDDGEGGEAGEAGECGEGDQAGRGLDPIEALAVRLLEGERVPEDPSSAFIEMCAAVAVALRCTVSEVQRVRAAALLHDIGKVAIPEEVLRRPGPLSDQEWQLVRGHPVIAQRILAALPGLGEVARIIRHEHERWDGAGYPDGLAGEDIPIGSRIVLAADSYQAITAGRPYRPARSHGLAVRELTRCAGSQFDPSVAAALIDYLDGR